MRLLALSALCPLAFAAALSLMVWTSTPAPELRGEIVMEQASFCDLFVVKTDAGLAVARDESHWPLAISSSTHISGLRRDRGPQTIRIEDRADLRIRVTQWYRDWELARAHFERECDPRAPAEHFEMQARGFTWKE